VDSGLTIVSSISPDVQGRLDAAGLTLGRFSWARSGRFIYFEGVSQGVRNLWRITIDPATLDWIGGPDRLTTGIAEDRDITISPDDARLVFSARALQTRLWSFPFNAVTGRLTGGGEPLTSGGAGEQDAEAVRDGSKLVYSATRGGRQELWERSLVERRDRLMLASNGWLSRPHWSPDGTRLAYAKRRNGRSRDVSDAVVAVLSVKDGAEHLFTKPGGPHFIPSDWSPDGARLVGGCPQGLDKPVAICVLDVPSTTAVQSNVRTIATHPTHNLFEQRFSPDQRWISFMAVDRGDSALATVYVMPASGGQWRAITDGKAYDDKPHWSPDGRTIYFASNRGGLWNVWGRHFDPETGTAVGDPFRVTSFDSPRQTLATQLSRMQFAISNDRLFLPITETSGELWMLENVDR
jgi:Tol biopolymer transport system component